MFESTLSAQGLNDGERRAGPLTAAVIGHLAVVLAIAGVAAMIIPPITPPPEPPPIYVTVLRPPEIRLDPVRSNPPPPRRGSESPSPARAADVPRVPERTQPSDTPETTAAPPDAGPVEGPTEGGGGGPNGHGDGADAGLDDGDPGSTGGNGVDPVHLTGDMVTPVLLVKVEPSYPEVARKARLGGRVTIQAVIGLDGNVESAEILASTNSLFDRTAIEAVERWRYRPALMNGKPVRVYFTVRVDFSVR